MFRHVILVGVKVTLAAIEQGFFSKFLMGGLKISDGEGGGTCKKNQTEAKTAHLMHS